jgi:1-acyl-sn-glycerol-3-phosphate acyltransferase
MRPLAVVVALWRLFRSTLHVLHGMAVMTRFPQMSESQRYARIRWWSAAQLRHLGLTVEVTGKPNPGATLVVANHISFLDIAAIHAAVPHARFVSKADVLKWPLLGWLIRNAGTLFIERERKRDALRVVHTMAEALARGETVAVFPEGTTGTGTPVLPFHANLLQAAVSTGTPVQPVALRYADGGATYSTAVEYIGDTSLLQSLWRVAMAPGLSVRVDVLDAVPSGAGGVGADRRRLAETLRERIAATLPAR